MPFYQKHVGFEAKQSNGWRHALKILLFLAISSIIVGFFAFTVLAAWVSRDLPDPNTITSRDIAQSTQIYDRTGTHLLYEVHGDQNRRLVKIEDVPAYAKSATISVEDKDFYKHGGIYWKGVARAAIYDIFHLGPHQGASTLTQQLIKNAILTNERTLTRKLKELILALQIERVYTKDQILQLYFNEIPYGSTIYGIESAAQNYFGKSAHDLTMDEAALLAAIPQAPDFYSPYGIGSHGDNRPALVARQHHILSLMVEQGYISQDQAVAAKKIDTLKKLRPKSLGNIQAPHFVMYVRSLLEDKYGVKKVEEGGLKVITTLDWDKQQIAEAAVKKGVDDRGKQYQFTNAALISLDPKTGQILAMVGSHDFFDNAHDGQVNVTIRPRQPGSSFKPIVYAAGFIKGFLPDTILWDVNTVFKTEIGKDYNPHDYDGKERGPVTVRQALQGSLNLPAVKMLYLVGVSRVLDFAESLGYTTLSVRSRFGLSLVLGGGEVTPLEHAQAYSAFATEGVLNPTSAVLHVEDPNGQVLEEWKSPAETRVMDAQIARLISNVLSDNAARASIFGGKNFLTLPDRPVAAKTGTTNNDHDAWTAGYTPSLVAVVWVGNNNNAAMKKGADGSIVAAPIWQQYMAGATRGTPVETFTPPDPPQTTSPVMLGQVLTKTVKVNRINNKLASASTPPDLIENRTVYEAHDILYYIDKDDPTGPPPADPTSDPQFANWEKAVQDWVTRTQWHTTSTTPTEVDDNTVPTVASNVQVQIISPAAGQILSSRDITVQANITAQATVTRIDVILDGSVITTQLSSASWSFSAHIPDTVSNGQHQLVLRATTSDGSQGEASEMVDLETQQ